MEEAQGEGDTEGDAEVAELGEAEALAFGEADGDALAVSVGDRVGVGDGPGRPLMAGWTGTLIVSSPACWKVSVTLTVCPTRTRPFIPVSSGTKPSPSL